MRSKRIRTGIICMKNIVSSSIYFPIYETILPAISILSVLLDLLVYVPLVSIICYWIFFSEFLLL